MEESWALAEKVFAGVECLLYFARDWRIKRRFISLMKGEDKGTVLVLTGKPNDECKEV